MRIMQRHRQLYIFFLIFIAFLGLNFYFQDLSSSHTNCEQTLVHLISKSLEHQTLQIRLIKRDIQMLRNSTQNSMIKSKNEKKQLELKEEKIKEQQKILEERQNVFQDQQLKFIEQQNAYEKSRLNIEEMERILREILQKQQKIDDEQRELDRKKLIEKRLKKIRERQKKLNEQKLLEELEGNKIVNQMDLALREKQLKQKKIENENKKLVEKKLIPETKPKDIKEQLKEPSKQQYHKEVDDNGVIKEALKAVPEKPQKYVEHQSIDLLEKFDERKNYPVDEIQLKGKNEEQEIKHKIKTSDPKKLVEKDKQVVHHQKREELNGKQQEEKLINFGEKQLSNSYKIPEDNAEIAQCISNKTVILTIGRSGSTLIGDIFKSHSNVSYMFEPLEKTYDKWNAVKLNHGPSELSKLKQAVISTLNTVLNKVPAICNHIVLKILQQRIPGGLHTVFDNFKHLNIKYIQLVRDPRAVFYSMLKLHWFNEKQLAKEAKRHCEILYMDISYGKTLYLSGRFEIIRYEDFCMNLDDYSKYFLESINIFENAQYERYIAKLLKATRKEANPYHDTLRDVGTPVTEWRKSIGIRFVNVIELECKNVMSVLGYQFINGDIKVLRDIKKPLY